MAVLAVIDTNVLVSALLSKYENSATVEVVRNIFRGSIIPLFSVDILTEYIEVLQRKKFKFDRSVIEVLIQSIIQNGIQLEGIETNEVLPDPDDLIFYEVAMEKEGEAYLVTGNKKHFPSKPFIVTPAEMMEIIYNN